MHFSLTAQYTSHALNSIPRQPAGPAMTLGQ